uniref:PorV/PorQ family protein n=1 Tax=candidate division WOR-3 bacterium TaxID=2052148 RepID=A0A7V1EI67_UNCW3
MILFFVFNIYIDNSTKLSVGIQSNGLGGITTLVDEGLSVFHNPAVNFKTEFNFIIGRWLYGTNVMTAGASYKNNAFGLYYLDYGDIQGYDEYGLPTNRFSPYDLNIGIARKFGLLGISIKNFQSRIDSVTFIGIALGTGMMINSGNFSIGAKIDNIGGEFVHRVDVPLIFATGIKYNFFEDFGFFIETRGRDIELSIGLIYGYENLKIFAGMKYIKPASYIEKPSLSDCHFSGGLMITFDEYELGYSFVYTQFSSAHQIGIKFTP